MPTYKLPNGTILGQAQLQSQFPNTSWDWSLPVTNDLAGLVGLTIIPDPIPSAPTLADKQAALLARLEPQRLVRQNAGLPYTFAPAVVASDGVTVVAPAVTGTIQTRDQTLYPDVANINGETTAALILQSQGVTSAAISFRDQQNVTHAMTPAQIIAMGIAVSSFISATYAAKWNIQNQINALTEQTVDSFDITQGWPA
jgi:hypothetical protein